MPSCEKNYYVKIKYFSIKILPSPKARKATIRLSEGLMFLKRTLWNWLNILEQREKHSILLIKRFHPIHVCSRVNQPSCVQTNNISVYWTEEEWSGKRFPEKQPRNKCRNDNTSRQHKSQVIFMLKHNKRISFQITHVYFCSKLFDIGVLFAQQPSHMREEKTSSRVVRVSICITKFVVNSVVKKLLWSKKY